MKINFEKEKLITTFSIIGFSVLFVFGIDNIFFVKNVYPGVVEISFAIILYINLVIFKFKKNINFASRIMVLLLLLSLLFMYIDGGIGGRTGVYWYFTFPVLAFFLLDERIGILATTILLSLTTIICLFFSTPFTFLETRQLIFAVITVSLLVRYYWKSNFHIKKMLIHKNIELLKYSEQIKENEALENEKKLEMERTKMAMFNLLEDARDLEKELIVEKRSVEEKISLRTKELYTEKAKLTASIEALAKAFVMVDLEGNVILVNNNLNKIFDKDNETWTVKSIDEAFAGNFKFKEAVEKALKGKEKAEYDDIEFGSRVLQIRFSPVYEGVEGNRVITGALAIIGDVTDEKVHERSKDEFFSIASHELRTPLTAIRGNTSMILDYYKDQIKDPELKSMITDTHDAAVRLIGIVNDFLDLSRLEQNRMVYKLADVSLHQATEDVISQLDEIAKNKKVKLDFKIDDKIKVKADPDKLKQVLFNMVGNSLKYTEKGSVNVTAKVEGQFVKVYIEDTGVGIPLANQSLLFRKFQQAGSSTLTRDAAKGTGLGLFISKLIVEGMGGKINLEKSVIGKGSIFTFTLPTAKLK